MPRHEFFNWSLRGHFLQKAKWCDTARRTYTERLAAADRNDVFKYIILLNCIECQGYIAEAQLQAHQSFRWSTRAAVAGFLIIVATLVIMISDSMLNQDKKIEVAIATIGTVSSLVTAFISGIFFHLYKQSLEKMEEFHRQLRDIQKIAFELYFKGISGASTQRDEEGRDMLSSLHKVTTVGGAAQGEVAA